MEKLKSVNVLQLGKFFPLRGGVEKVMYWLMEGLSANEVRCDMLCASEAGPASTSQINAFATLICTRSLCKLFGTMIAPDMVSTLRRIAPRYQIIHIHHPDPMASLALRLSGYTGRVVLHWHSDIVKQHRLLKAYMPLQRWLLRRADAVICTSEAYLRGSEHLRGHEQKCRVVPIGIRPVRPDGQLAAAVEQLYSGRKLVFALGRLVPYKGFEHLVKAASLLPADYCVAIGGEGPMRGALERAIAEYSLQDRVKLLGRISDQEVGAYLEACTMFCLPSVYKTEAFGIVQLEAMSVGKPVVATDIPGSGVGWVNAHGVSGLNVPIADPKALAEAIQQIASTADSLKTFSEGARHRYRSVFTYDQMVRAVADIYLTLL